jgi:hypothetical protein
MRLTVTIDVAHDTLDVPVLLFALPMALDSVRRATSAGVAETGPQGMDVQPPGVDTLIKVFFRVDASETVRRLPVPRLPDAPPPLEATG